MKIWKIRLPHTNLTNQHCFLKISKYRKRKCGCFSFHFHVRIFSFHWNTVKDRRVVWALKILFRLISPLIFFVINKFLAWNLFLYWVTWNFSNVKIQLIFSQINSKFILKEFFWWNIEALEGRIKLKWLIGKRKLVSSWPHFLPKFLFFFLSKKNHHPQWKWYQTSKAGVSKHKCWWMKTSSVEEEGKM